MSATAYRVRDAFGAPGLLSLSRVGMAAAFPCVVDEPWSALGLVAAAGVTDVLDGALARRLGQCTPTGAALDAVTDKLFAGSVMLSLLLSGRLPPGWAVLLCTRELGELPLLIWLLLVPRARAVGPAEARANWLGKLTTVLQFGALCALLFQSASFAWWIAATAASGAIAAVAYWRSFARLARPRVRSAH